MPHDSDRELLKKLGISFKPPGSNVLPLEHCQTFNRIRSIRKKNLDDYNKDSISQSNVPWRKHTHKRVESIANCAAKLVNQESNEAGWRLNIENPVFHRFRVDVACPICRARIWMSEVEAHNDLSGTAARNLQERRDRREPCICPAEHRPSDSRHDVGESRLFDDRAEAAIMYGPPVEMQLPTKKPDRIFGLKKTKTFAKILDVDGTNSGEAPRCSPFKDCNDPLLFPFLIYEAKRETRSVGFQETLIQTALPIWELLKLQESVRADIPEESHSTGPLVWFFASRGDSWRVYGCYITRTEPKQYEIMQLWDGCITEKDKTLQLLLIVDYVADWARDIFRSSILRHLKSTVSRIAYDQVSISNDSDVYSMRGAHPLRRISNLVPAPPTIVDANEILGDLFSDPGPISHESILSVPIPNTEGGSLRTATLFESRIFGLRLTEHNAEHLIRFSKGVYRDGKKSMKMARGILNLLSGPKDCIAISETDLDYLEDSWTGDIGAENRAYASSNSTTFFILIEFSTFMTNTWDIAKEISYLAVSKPALDVLNTAAGFKIPPPGLGSIEQRARPCTHGVLRDAIECLRSGSPWQNFCSAISCTRVSLCSLPVRKRADHTPDTSAFSFAHTSQLWMRRTIEKCHKYSQKQPLPRVWRVPFGMSYKEQQLVRSINPTPQQLTFIRDLKSTQEVSLREDHSIQICGRCQYVSNGCQEDHRFSLIAAPPIPEYGMVLVGTLDLTAAPPTRHDLCLMAFDIIPEIANNSALAVVVDDLLQSSKVFNTIRHPLPTRYANGLLIGDTIWNLPLPYRPLTKRLRYDIQIWSLELQGRQIPISNCAERQMDYWNNLQLLLYFLSHGSTWEDSRAKVEGLVKKSGSRSSFYDTLDWTELRKTWFRRG